MSTLYQASREWASRPADERFVSLLDMANTLAAHKANSRVANIASKRLECRPMDDDEMGGIRVYGPNGHGYEPSNWAFGQLAQLGGAPAGYLRTLPAPIACDNINWGLQHAREIEDVQVMLRKYPEKNDFRFLAATGPNYGRIYCADVAQALATRFGDGVTGQWRVPGEWGQRVAITSDNTTMYASDRDMFVFLCDEENRVTMDNRRAGITGSTSLARGFFVWNSDVGSKSIGAAFFLFDYVCGNRIVWGAQGYQEIRIRHTVSAPDRWLQQISPVLVEYAHASAKPVEQAIKAAQARKLDDAKEWLAKRFSKSMAKNIMDTHEAEENRPVETMWDAVTGMTAYAKSIQHQDARVAVERDAGKMLDLVAA